MCFSNKLLMLQLRDHTFENRGPQNYRHLVPNARPAGSKMRSTSSGWLQGAGIAARYVRPCVVHAGTVLHARNVGLKGIKQLVKVTKLFTKYFLGSNYGPWGRKL